MDKSLRKVAIYINIFNCKQYSLEEQLYECQEKIKYKRWFVVKTYIDETNTYAEFHKMISDSKNKLFDDVVVYSIHQFGKKCLETLNNIDKLKGTNIITILENIQTNDSIGKLYLTILSGMRDFALSNPGYFD